MLMRNELITFIVAATTHALKGGETIRPKAAKAAPAYFTDYVPHQVVLERKKETLAGQNVVFEVGSYAPEILFVEASVVVDNPFSRPTFELREKVIGRCEAIAHGFGVKDNLIEEFSIMAVSEYSGDPNDFLTKHGPAMVSFLKSEPETLDKKEIDYTLASQLRYGQNDLVVYDWDGAYIFEKEHDIEEIVELLRLANLQLLRYRNLDHLLDKRLQNVAGLVRQASHKQFIFKTRQISQAFREVITVRTRSLVDFAALERDVRLFGDWYAARLFEGMSRKFKIPEWRATIKEKQDYLEDIYSIASENFSVSRQRFLELSQIVIEFVLIIGWFVLLFFEFKLVK